MLFLPKHFLIYQESRQVFLTCEGIFVGDAKSPLKGENGFSHGYNLIIHSASVAQSFVWAGRRAFLCPDAGEGGVSVKAYGKSSGNNIYGCRYCLYWKGNRKGCVHPEHCSTAVQQPSGKNAVAIQSHVDKDNEVIAPISECRDCPYGRDSPCIGWCTKEVMRAVGLLKERDSHHV